MERETVKEQTTDMEREIVKEQTTDTAERTGLDDEKEDENSSGSDTVRDETSTHWHVEFAPVSSTEEQGAVMSCKEAQESFQPVFEDSDSDSDSDEMEILTDTPDPPANKYYDWGPHRDELLGIVDSLLSHNAARYYATPPPGRSKEGQFIDFVNSQSDNTTHHLTSAYSRDVQFIHFVDSLCNNTPDHDTCPTASLTEDEFIGLLNSFSNDDAHHNASPFASLTEDDLSCLLNSLFNNIAHNNANPSGSSKKEELIGLLNPLLNNIAHHKVKPSGSSKEDEFTDFVKSLSVSMAHEVCTRAKNYENPAGGPQATSISPNPHLDQAKEPVETSAGAESEMEESEMEESEMEESDEMSDTTELATNQVEFLHKEKVETKPFNFLGCPDNVRKQILRCALHSDRQIRPYWNFGALEVAANKACKENYDTMVVAFAGNKELVDETTTILYGENVFKLRHARVSLWWLKRIGPNISKLRHLAIIVEEGVMDGCGTRYETLWRRVFDLLQGKHKLQGLSVSFKRWTLEVNSDDGLDPTDLFVWEPRHILLRSLFAFRGLDRADIVPGPFVTEYCAETLEGALIMAPGQTNDDVVKCLEDVELPERSKIKYSFA